MAGFTLSNEWPFATVLQDTRWQFYRVGLFNAIRVVVLSIIGCTIIGVIVGVSRLSRNRLLSGLAESYVEFFRNMPLVVQLFFLYTVVSLAVDILFSFSVLIVIYGLFNAVEWNYKISTIDGILENEPLSMFKLGIIMLILSSLLRFKLDDLGLNNFTTKNFYFVLRPLEKITLKCSLNRYIRAFSSFT